ncbi:MAG TPA: hypothetical protein VNX26_11855 [Candidatus Acidoferrum sp.]|jgi:hypothetical protein|nr:hypothetical protein [Candidatus Acidoferrum sp.]
MRSRNFSVGLAVILASFTVSLFAGMPAAAQKTPEAQAPAGTAMHVLTRQNDNQHTGQNLRETILTPANVNSGSFGKLFSYPVDGQLYAQPLYVQNVIIPSKGTHNVVYVATENDSVYAFDADSAKANPNPLWRASFLNPPSVVGVPCAIGAGICQLFPIVGITGTPVINLANNTLYVVARTMETTNSVVSYVIRLHALNIMTGAEQSGSPVVICSGSGNGGCAFPGQTLLFAPQHQQGRPGLLLVNQPGFAQGIVYMGFAGNSGWVLAYDASTLQLVASFFTDSGKHVIAGLPGQGHSGVWGGGGAITADSNGNIYAITGDGYFDGITNWGDTLVKLVLTLNSSTGTYTLVPADYFTPSDQSCRFAQGLDFGSSSPLILPPQGGVTPDLIFAAAKSSTVCDSVSSIYIVNRDNMGHVGGQVSLSNAPAHGSENSPAYWASSTTQYIYSAGVDDSIRAFTVSSTGVSASSVMNTTNTLTNGTTPAISSNGTSNGILWALDRTENADILPGTAPIVLHAYDATKLSSELYNSTQASSGRDNAGPSVKFQVPTIVNGKVYVGTQNELDVYGLCPCPQ